MAKAVSNEERMRMKKERSEKRKEALKKIGQGVSKAVSAVKEGVKTALKNPTIRHVAKHTLKTQLENLADNQTLNDYLYGVPKKLKPFIGPVVFAEDTYMGPRYVNPKEPPKKPVFNSKPAISLKPNSNLENDDDLYKSTPTHSRFAVKAY